MQPAECFYTRPFHKFQSQYSTTIKEIISHTISSISVKKQVSICFLNSVIGKLQSNLYLFIYLFILGRG